MDWLFDIGNTRVKWTCAEGGRLRGPVRAAVTDASGWGDALAESLVESLAAAGGTPETAWLAAVADAAAVATLEATLARHFPALPVRRVTTPAAGGGVRVAYAEPARLGVDRYLAMVGARARLPEACLVVGAGTALTIDLLDASGTHHGGLIAPSPRLMIAAVEARTAHVRIDRQATRVDFATDTAAGLYSGAWNAALALIERAAVRARARLSGEAPVLLVHGGDGERLATALPGAELAPALVLEGLARHRLEAS